MVKFPQANADENTPCHTSQEEYYFGKDCIPCKILCFFQTGPQLQDNCKKRSKTTDAPIYALVHVCSSREDNHKTGSNIFERWRLGYLPVSRKTKVRGEQFVTPKILKVDVRNFHKRVLAVEDDPFVVEEVLFTEDFSQIGKQMTLVTPMNENWASKFVEK